MHPSFKGQSLTDKEAEIAVQLAATQHEAIVPYLIKLKAQSSPFLQYMFADNVIKGVKPVDWWTSPADCVHPETVSVAKQLLTVTSSPAGVFFFFFCGMHHYECVAPYVAINLHRGRF